MKITLRELIQIDSALGRVLEAPLPIKTAFKFRKIVKLLRTDVQVLEETRKMLIERYSVAEESGRRRLIEDTREEFEKEYQELMDQEIEFDFEPVSINELSSVSLSAKEAFDLERFIGE